MANRISTFSQYMLSIANREKNIKPTNDANENVDEDKAGKVPKVPVQKYVSKLPQDKVITSMDMSPYFFPLLFASEKGPLGIWDKQVGQGYIKRRIEIAGGQRFHVIEMMNARESLGTFIAAPKRDWMALHVPLQHLVIVLRNVRRNFSFEVQVLDSLGFLRRFNCATWFNPSHLKKTPFICQLPLELQLGWNEIHLDLNDLLWRTYKSNYFETERLMINANCKLRQVFFCADNIINGELPIPSMQRFENMKMVNPAFEPLNHPNYTEPGPSYSRDVPLPLPPLTKSRVEEDLSILQTERLNQLSRIPLKVPFRFYFQDLLQKSKAGLASRDINDEDQDNDDGNNEGTKSPSSSGDPIDEAQYPILLPTGLTGPISLGQLMQRSRSKSGSRPQPSNTNYNPASIVKMAGRHPKL